MSSYAACQFVLEPVVTTEIILNSMADQTQKTSQRLLASGGALSAVFAASCCIAPLLLLSLGVSGAWIGNLTALEPYNWIFIAVAVACLGLGFWHVHSRKVETCEDSTYCARAEASPILKSALWLATALVAASATVDWWAPHFY